MTKTIKIDQSASKAYKVLEDFKKRTLSQLQYQLDMMDDKNSDRYKKQKERIKYLENLYTTCSSLNTNYMTLQALVVHIIEKFESSKVLESSKTYRFQHKILSELYELMKEIKTFYKNQ